MESRIIQGDWIEGLRTLPDGCVHTCVTSPPYWALRDYGTGRWEGGSEACDHSKDRSSGVSSSTLGGGKGTTNHQQEASFRDVCGKCGATMEDGQLGLEDTIGEYLERMVEGFAEIYRVLRDDGTLWLNLGDTYAGGGNYRGYSDLSEKQRSNGGAQGQVGSRPIPRGLKSKDMCGIPWRVAFALQADGWYLRSDIIWAKPNPMPESVTDRPTKAHEYLFLLTKAERYYYDAEAIREPQVCDEATFYAKRDKKPHKGQRDPGGMRETTGGFTTATFNPAGRNKRTVWTVATQPFKDAHFATFPPKLIEPCVLAGCPAQACAACGAPWVREVEKSRTFESGSGRSGNLPEGKNGAGLQGGGETGDVRRGPCLHTKTLGFSPTCTCHGKFVRRRVKDEDLGEVKLRDYVTEYVSDLPLSEHPTVPGTVLDPFMGAGTTGVVAVRHGRRYLGRELNPNYIALAEERIREEEAQPRLLMDDVPAVSTGRQLTLEEQA